MRALGIGVGLTALVTTLLYIGWGREALLPALVLGGVATGIQVVSVALVRPAFAGETARLLKRWGLGMLLRLLGVALVALLVTLDQTHFPPLPTALGFLGVLVPLLFLEVRLVR
jgi:hypothetical protein